MAAASSPHCTHLRTTILMQGRHDWRYPSSLLRTGPSTPRRAVTLLVGGPGSGKGTIGIDIARQLGCSKSVAMSDILRQRQQEDAEGAAVPSASGDSLTSSAKLVGDDLACSAFESLLLPRKHDQDSNIMVDGFPRSQAQARSPRMLPHLVLTSLAPLLTSAQTHSIQHATGLLLL